MRRWSLSCPGYNLGWPFVKRLVRRLCAGQGTNPAMIELARQNALALSCGHSFIIFLGPGFYPVNVLKTVQGVPEVCRIFCATANSTEVIVAETELGRGILGVIDGAKSKGIESDEDIAARKALLRRFGYKM